MVFNANIYISFILVILLYYAANKLFSSIHYLSYRVIFWCVSLVLALLSFSIPAAYLTDTIGANPTYAQFRSYPYMELWIVAAAPFVAAISVSGSTKIKYSFIKSVFSLLCLAMLLFYTSVPFIKPLIKPLQVNLTNRWQDGVAMQSTPSTCGPSSLATILNYYGKQDTESDIAKHVFTSASGTENWYLARYAGEQGFNYQFSHNMDLAQVNTPAIIGVKLGSFGHFMVLFSHQQGIYEVADPLTGRAKLSIEQFNKRYYYTGFALSINPSSEYKKVR